MSHEDVSTERELTMSVCKLWRSQLVDELLIIIFTVRAVDQDVRLLASVTAMVLLIHHQAKLMSKVVGATLAFVGMTAGRRRASRTRVRVRFRSPRK